MGCGVSQAKDRRLPLDTADAAKATGLKLISCKVQLTADHVTKANRKFLTILDQEPHPAVQKHNFRLISVVERLVQRLICTVGYLDSRFSSKFLISLDCLHQDEESSRVKLRYLVRLDAVSTPGQYGELPPVRVLQGTGRDTLPAGFARIRVLGEYLEDWGDLINHHGYLRRDKIQERFMELLATAAGHPQNPSSPLEVDESRHCGSPGKVVDPLTLHHIFQMPPDCQCFYGPAESDEARFPDPRDFRIAIVEGVPDVRLHVSFLSPAAHTQSVDEDAEIVLTVCVGVADWPQQSDFPYRMPLDHPDVLLGYKAAQTGYILVPSGPHHSVRCDDRTSIWEIRMPAAQTVLLHHYSANSIVHRCMKLLCILMEILRSRGMKTINSYTLQTLLWWELEKTPRLEDWTASHLAKRVLRILDSLAVCLRQTHLRSYFSPSENLLLQPCVAEEDYRSDADILEAYLMQFQQDKSKFDLIDADLSVQDYLETATLHKWKQVLHSLAPTTARVRLGLGNRPASASYSRRQMEYIAVLFREILKLRHIQQTQRNLSTQVTVQPAKENHVDEFFYLLQSVFEQAKTRAWNNVGGEGKRRLREVMDSYDVSTAMMIDGLKRDGKLLLLFQSDMQLVAKVLECLHTAADSDGKILGPILKPYLSQLHRGSHQNCWFLAEWLKRTDNSEFEAVGAFSKLVLTEQLDPLRGLLDSVSKGWNWARHALYTLKAVSDQDTAELLLGQRLDTQNSGLRLIFAPSPGQTLQYTIRLSDEQSSEVAEYLREETPGRTPLSTLKRRQKADNYATIRSFPDTLYTNDGEFANRKDTWFKLRAWSEKQPPHGRLRDGSPLTVISMATRRQGTQRGLGGIVHALISLNKLTVLQEISMHLPEQERSRVLGDIQKLSREVHRLAVSRRRSDAYVSKHRFSFRKSPKKHRRERSSTLPHAGRRGGTEEVYRSRNELDLADADEQRRETGQSPPAAEATLRLGDSLLGTCRQLKAHNRIAVENIDFTTGINARYGTASKQFFVKTNTFPPKSTEMTEI